MALRVAAKVDSQRCEKTLQLCNSCRHKDFVFVALQFQEFGGKMLPLVRLGPRAGAFHSAKRFEKFRLFQAPRETREERRTKGRARRLAKFSCRTQQLGPLGQSTTIMRGVPKIPKFYHGKFHFQSIRHPKFLGRFG